MLLEDINCMHFPIVYKKSIPNYTLFDGHISFKLVTICVIHRKSCNMMI